MKDVLLRLKELIDHNGENYKKFAEHCGCAVSTVQNMFLRDSEPRSDLLEKVIDIYEVNPSWLLTGRGNMYGPSIETVNCLSSKINGMFIPYLDQTVSAGNGAELLDTESGDKYICIPKTKGKDGLRALKVSGDSMEPTLKNGSIVICETGGWEGDGVYVIRNAEFTFVKRIIKHPEGYSVVSDNALYPPYICKQEDMVIVGRVVFAVLRM